ncbi:translation initiation factor IF-2, chloroplastic-like [Phragmites australis]|uniref:translation initiation factor IF-2, chloroplastic-like n=1 Tax=Phragmites australis TaxID=29695 RepID=UPI002D791D49|nr:translation initiation factor IF-2, chloroplastic-like [Phragmites australis]XP_062185770.1 translation initiation factor IF-2, chloroplastic-like [Phragmites australis]
MTSPASVTNLGSNGRPGPLPVAAARRAHLVTRISFTGFDGIRRWQYAPGRLCRCMVITNLIEEKGVQFSSRGGVSVKADDDNDLLLKPPQKLVRPNGPPGAIKAASPPERKPAGATLEDREKVRESLHKVLEKAEKLEASSSGNGGGENAGSRQTDVSMHNGPGATAVDESGNSRKTKTLKSVWRKGNPVPTVRKVIRDQPRTETRDQSIPAAKSSASSPSKSVPPLLSKPSVAPPPRRPVKSDTSKEKKGPILIDKFASKRATIDPVVPEELLDPLKPVRGPPAKVRVDRRKKPNTPAGSRRRMPNDDGLVDEDTSDVPISGVPVRKGRRWSKAKRRAARLEALQAEEPVRVEILEVGEEGMLIEDLAYELAVSESEILRFLSVRGVMLDNVQTLDKDLVKMVCMEYDVEVLENGPVKVEEMAKKKEFLDEEDLDKLEVRPPIVTIMGHVDHGKTTLLDYIRKSKVVASEAGGITQGIGAYQVLVPVDGNPQACVFLDTPGHKAFGAMRARGARVTDICIIVVAADDGVQPQTSEAIAHARAAGVPIIIAINKIDKEGANPERVMQELSQIGLMPEMWGGDTPMIQISALTGDNVEELLETVMLVAELQELKANPHRNAKGTVIEACLDKAKGPLATLVVQNGTLNKADIIMCGEAFGKIRAMYDDRGKLVDKAGPSNAVQVIGLNNVPLAGDEFEAVDNLDIARERANERADVMRIERISAKAGEGKVTLSSIAASVSSGKQAGIDTHELNVILKVDFQGSIEAIRQAIQALPQENVSLRFLLQAPGDVSVSDVDLAVASDGIIFGFNVRAPGSVKTYAKKKSVEIRLYKVIYDLIDDLRNAMEGLLEPAEEEVPLGSAKVRAVFSSGSGKAAGCMITTGKVVQDCNVRVIRKGKEVYVGTLDSLRRVKETIKEVGAGLECGIGVDDFDEWEEGDVIEAFNTVKKSRTLEEASATVTAALKDAGVQL